MGFEDILSYAKSYDTSPIDKLNENIKVTFEELNTNGYLNSTYGDVYYQGFHPSSISGISCLRREYYKYLGQFQERFDYSTIRRFDNGHGIHDNWQSYFSMMKDISLLGRWKCRSCNTITKGISKKPDFCDNCGDSNFKYKEIQLRNDEFRLSGKCDGVILIDDVSYVLEIKSIEQFSFNKLKEPLEKHKIQLGLYMYLLNIYKGVFLYEKKDSTHLYKLFYYEYEPDKMKKYFEILKELVYYADNRIVPPFTICSDCKNCDIYTFKCY